MKIAVDLDLCQGHGVCCNEAPGLFELDEAENIVRVLVEEPGEDQREALLKAARYCPTFAITIED